MADIADQLIDSEWENQIYFWETMQLFYWKRFSHFGNRTHYWR